MSIFSGLRRTDPALTAAIQAHRQAVASAYLNQQFGVHRAVVMSPKGGVGKTTIASLLALTLAELRGETVMALDGNLHTGTLRGRLVPPDAPTPLPMTQLAEVARKETIRPEWPELCRYSDLANRVRVFSNKGADLSRVESMSREDYLGISAVLCRAGQLLVSDMGTSITSPWAVAALEAADTLVVATDTDEDSLDWTVEMMSSLAGSPLSYQPTPADYSAVADGRFAPLVSGAVLVVNPGKIKRDPAEYEALLQWFSAVGAQVVAVPDDPGLAGLINPAALRPASTEAHLRVAAHVASRLPLIPSSAAHTALARG